MRQHGEVEENVHESGTGREDDIKRMIRHFVLPCNEGDRDVPFVTGKLRQKRK